MLFIACVVGLVAGFFAGFHNRGDLYFWGGSRLAQIIVLVASITAACTIYCEHADQQNFAALVACGCVGLMVYAALESRRLRRELEGRPLRMEGRHVGRNADGVDMYVAEPVLGRTFDPPLSHPFR